jgi:hypothetical protein
MPSPVRSAEADRRGTHDMARPDEPNDRGQTFSEYAFVLLLVVIVVAGAVAVLAPPIQGFFEGF